MQYGNLERLTITLLNSNRSIIALGIPWCIRFVYSKLYPQGSFFVCNKFPTAVPEWQTTNGTLWDQCLTIVNTPLPTFTAVGLYSVSRAWKCFIWTKTDCLTPAQLPVWPRCLGKLFDESLTLSLCVGANGALMLVLCLFLAPNLYCLESTFDTFQVNDFLIGYSWTCLLI